MKCFEFGGMREFSSLLPTVVLVRAKLHARQTPASAFRENLRQEGRGRLSPSLLCHRFFLKMNRIIADSAKSTKASTKILLAHVSLPVPLKCVISTATTTRSKMARISNIGRRSRPLSLLGEVLAREELHFNLEAVVEKCRAISTFVL